MEWHDAEVGAELGWECKMFTIGQHLWRERGRIEQGKVKHHGLQPNTVSSNPWPTCLSFLEAGVSHQNHLPNKVTWSRALTPSPCSHWMWVALKMVLCWVSVSWKWICWLLIPPHSYAANHAVKKGLASAFLCLSETAFLWNIISMYIWNTSFKFWLASFPEQMFRRGGVSGMIYSSYHNQFLFPSF